MKPSSALTVPASALMLFIAACERQPEETVKSEPEIQVAAPENLAAEPAPQPSPSEPAANAQDEQGGTDDWRSVISREDRARLAKMDQAWTVALKSARDSGFSEELRDLGVIAMSLGATEGGLQPPPGNYQCRTIKLGKRGDVGLGLIAYPYFRCRVELTRGGDLILEKTTGSQRFHGLIYPDSDSRLVYIGTQAWGDEKGYPAYGTLPERDQSGYLERIGNGQWRLLIPFPKQESQLDIIEIIR